MNERQYESPSYCKYLIQYYIMALKGIPEHIHIFIDVSQAVAPCDFVRTFTSIRANELFKIDLM